MLDITPRRPLFTIVLNGEAFPLIASRCTSQKRGGIILSGMRKLKLSTVHTVEWKAQLHPKGTIGGLDVPVRFSVTIQPPLPIKECADLLIEIVSPMHAPEPWWFPYAPLSHHGSISLWSKLAGIGLSLAVPASDKPPLEVELTRDYSTLIRRTITSRIRRGKASYDFHMRFDLARTRSHAQFLHLRHAIRHLLPGLPSYIPSPPDKSMRERAMHALEHLCDKGTYDVVGVERVYVRGARESMADGAHHSSPSEFVAGFPDFPLDSARAMIDWHMLFGDETGAKLGLSIARGIATDFAVLPDEERQGVNKGAFWDRREGKPGQADGQYTDFSGEDYHSISSTARIARGLLSVNERTKDLTCLNAALNACQWLILKQNANGYYDGDLVGSRTGQIVGSVETMAGIEVAASLLLAYRATNNEVFIKAGLRTMRHITTLLMPTFVASPIFGQGSLPGSDTPATVASLVRVLGLIYAETPTRRVREDLEFASTWLRSWDLSDSRDKPAHSENFGDRFEVARACLQMHVVERNPVWLDLALRVISTLPQHSRAYWQNMPVFIECMIALTALLPSSAPDILGYRVKLGWSEYVPDPNTAAYISVNAVDDDATLDFLPLTSQVDDKALVAVLSDRPIGYGVRLIQSGRTPSVRDAVTGEIVGQPLELHPMPFECPMRWGCYIIEP